MASHLSDLLKPIAELHLDPANARKHGDESIAALKASLARFGQQRPVLIDANNVAIAGNGVLQAARELGWTHIAAVQSDMHSVERTAYGIADNRLAELSTWDHDVLRRIATELPPDLASVSLAGLNVEPTPIVEEPSDQEDTVQPASAHVTQRGDVWLLGSNRLLCGDSTSHDDVKRVMAGAKAVLFATDPPYLVNYDGTNHPGTRLGGTNKDWSATYGVTWDDADGNSELYDKFIGAAVANAIDQRAAWYVWHASKRQAMLEHAWQKHGGLVHCQIIWAKNRGVITRTWYAWRHEPCLMGWLQGFKPERVGDQILTTVWDIDIIPNGSERPDHPTPKPLEVFEIPMLQHTKPGDVCYEPFAGSGTQIIAAQRLGRRCFAIEISPVYCDVIVRRWAKVTGEQARLEGTGATFRELAHERGIDLDEDGRCRSQEPSSADTQAAVDS